MLLISLRWVRRFEYAPYNGVAGPPAVHDYPPNIEIFSYVVGFALCAGLGWLMARVCSRSAWAGSRPGRAFAIATGALGLGLATLYLLMRFRFSPAAGHLAWLIRSIAREPQALTHGLVGLALIGFLAWPAWGRGAASTGPPEPQAKPQPDKPPRPLAALAVALQVWLLVEAFAPRGWVGVLFYLPALLIVPALWLPPRNASGEVDTVVQGKPYRLEWWAWLLLAIAPLAAWPMRLGRTLGWPVPGSVSLSFATLGVLLLPTLLGVRRRRLGLSPRVGPIRFLPWSVLAWLALGSGASAGYDAFHQGEFIYAAHAMAHGARQWIDIFFVHGFAINTLIGWLVGPPRIEAHSLDFSIYCLLAAVAAALACWFYLRAWGERWGLAALALGALCAASVGPPSARYAPMWLTLLMTLEYARTAKPSWMVLAGAVGWAALFFSLDTGVLVLATGFLWAAVWGGLGLTGPVGGEGPRHRLGPLVAYAAGVLIAAVPTVIWFVANDQLGVVWDLHLEYFRVKRHADKIPLDFNTLAVLISPLVGILGVWVSLANIRRRDRSPLAAMIGLLTLFSILAFGRALDRADFGHVAYAMVPTWALAASLVVWQATRASESGQAGMRSIVLTVLIIMLPYAHPRLGAPAGNEAMLPKLADSFRWYAANAQAPFSHPVTDPVAQDFFDVVGELKERVTLEDGFYDFSNQPAFYAWAGLLSPSRFYTAYYASGMRWQDEVIQALDRKRPRWVLFRGPNPYWNHPDDIPTYVRQWKIAAYLLEHYRPAERLAGDSLLLERFPRDPGVKDKPPSEARATHPDLWLKPTDLHKLPLVWGRSDRGAPPLPQQVLWRGAGTVPPEGPLSFDIENPSSLAGAVELHLTCDPPKTSRVRVEWNRPDPPDSNRALWLDLDPSHAGPYRIRLDNLPAWVWGGPPRQIRLQVDPKLKGRHFEIEVRGTERSSSLVD